MSKGNFQLKWEYIDIKKQTISEETYLSNEYIQKVFHAVK